MKYLYFFNRIKNITLNNKKEKASDLSALKRNLFVSNRQKNNRSADTDITQTLERGRSMIEMLGVLVIMGLLAVGGIWGYQYAMNTYRAGQIQDVMTQAKALTVTKRTASQNSLSSFLDKTATAGLNPAVNIVETTDASGRTIRIYTITLNGVGEQVQRFAYARKPNFAKMDIMLAPSADAVEETDQSKESWVDAGMSEGEYDILQQYTTLQSGKSLLFAFTTRSRRGIAGGSDGDGENAPTECPADMPFYDEATDSCSRCDVSLNEYWDPTQMKCIACSEPQDYWDETNYACSCPPSIPVYDSATNTCVECLVDTDCKDEANPVCNAEHRCEPCPEGQFYNGTQCMLNCEDKKIWDREQQTCVCNPAYYETDANGYCVCKTDETVEASIKSNGLNASSYGCKLHIQDLGRLKGTYYFKWISGVHIYSIASQTSTPNGVRLHAGTAETGKVTDTEIGAIFNVDMSPCPNYPAGISTSYRASCLKKQLALTKPKYFSFDGTKMISLWFYDGGTCTDNSGTMTVELRKVISSCPEAGGSSGGGSSDVECTTNADCSDSSKPICNASHICEACPDDTPHWNGTTCIACSDSAPVWNEETKECEVCPEQTPHWNGTTCIACSDTTPIWNAETKECEACPDQTPHWNGTTCIACSDSAPVWNEETRECEACSSDTPHWNGTTCIACSDSAPVWNEETRECEACSSDTPHWNGTACIACSDSKPIWNAEIKECEACPNDTPYWNGTTCIDCSDSAPVWNSVAKECETCPSETPHWNGATCIACSDSAPVWNSVAKECEACPSETPHWNGATCIACSDDTPLWNSADRICEVCPYPTPVWNGTACEECPESKPAWDGNQCEACPANTPYWNESEMDCESCPIETPHWDGIACVVCPDGTQWDGSSCVPNSCSEKLVNAGVDSSTFTVDPNDPTRIIAPGELRLSGDIDLSECSLFVGNFDYRGGYTTLKVKNLISKDQIYMTGEKLGIEATEDVIGNTIYETCSFDCNITANRIIGGVLMKPFSFMEANEIRYCRAYDACFDHPYGGLYELATEDYVETNSDESDSNDLGIPLPSPWKGIHGCYSPLPKKLEVCHMLCYDDTPRWNSETRECEACPAETPHWNGTECIACSDSKPVWNAETKECEACPSETPVWNGTRCVECVADSDCASNTDGRTICDTDTNTCQCVNSYCSTFATNGSCTAFGCCSSSDLICQSYDTNGDCLRHRCCRSGEKYCAMRRDNGTCVYEGCCSGGTVYCEEYNSDGSCKYEGCCSTNNVYCAFLDSDGDCYGYACYDGFMGNGTLTCTGYYDDGTCHYQGYCFDDGNFVCNSWTGNSLKPGNGYCAQGYCDHRNAFPYTSKFILSSNESSVSLCPNNSGYVSAGTKHTENGEVLNLMCCKGQGYPCIQYTENGLCLENICCESENTKTYDDGTYRQGVCCSNADGIPVCTDWDSGICTHAECI